jgi:hypothetical protein
MTKTPTRNRVPAHKYAFLWRLMADTTLSASAKGVAVTLLLKYHNTKTGRCNPSIAGMAKTAGCCRRTAFSAIAELKNTGWIAVEGTKGGSPTHTNQYSFDFERVKSAASVTSAETAPVTGAGFALVQDLSPGVQTSAHELSRTTRALRREGGREISSQRAPDGALEEKFEQLCFIWRVKPDGVNKAKAQKAFLAVCGDGGSPFEIVASAQNWVAKTEPRYLKKLEDWLGNGAWLNDPRPSRPSRRPGGKQSLVAIARQYGGE